MTSGKGTLRHMGLTMTVCVAAITVSSVASAASSWAMLDAKTGRIIGEDDGQRLHPPASLAKMMTIYLTFEALKSGKISWATRVPISKNAAAKIPMKLGVKPGDTISVREAVDSMIVLSANDVATAMGEFLSGSEAQFARVMTQRARKIGMKDTVFANPSGLTDRTQQVTTARDMTVLGLALRRDYPREYALFSQPSFSFRGRTYRGHNNLMYRYNGVDGIKTGYTSVSGYNLVSSLNADGKQLVGAVLGGTSARKRDELMASLLTRFSTGGTITASAAPVRKTAPAPVPAPVVVAEAGKTSLRSGLAPVPNERPAAFAAVTPSEAPSLAHAEVVEQGDGGEPVASTGGGIWRIQVGSLPDRASATQLQTKASNALRASGLSAQSAVEVFKGDVSTFYRVRFSGFDSGKSAANACAQMKRQSIDCFVVADR